ncbi:hypothetical protein BKA70DRAFT_1251013 [Coprinopsis sp. MPI-PUGE-AT-0042]|nr:hypothetical protein BKA70DRAFT_1251013 [Coprinopsis sp. MPI-PUGE-AT-0042]
MQLRGRCTIEIGPHIFDDVPFYEVSHTVTLAAASDRRRGVPAAVNRDAMTGRPSLTQPAAVPHWKDATLAACSDAEFVMLSQLFRERKATTEQAERLGELIQQLFSNKTVGPSPGSRNTFDVLLGFPDDHDYQLLLPPGPAIFRPSKSGAPNDWDLLLRLPFDDPEQEDAMEDNQDSSSSEYSEQGKQYYKAKLKLKGCPEAVSSLLLRWLGSEHEAEEYRDVFRYMERNKPHQLHYKLASGVLYQQVQDAALPHPMSLLKERRN